MTIWWSGRTEAKGMEIVTWFRRCRLILPVQYVVLPQNNSSREFTLSVRMKGHIISNSPVYYQSTRCMCNDYDFKYSQEIRQALRLETYWMTAYCLKDEQLQHPPCHKSGTVIVMHLDLCRVICLQGWGDTGRRTSWIARWWKWMRA